MKKIDLEALKTIALSEKLKPSLDTEEPFGKVNKFITLFKIKDGKNLVRAALIYKVYADWSEHPIAKISFYKEFSNMFVSKTINDKTFYLLNYKPGGLVKKGQELTDLRNSVE